MKYNDLLPSDPREAMQERIDALYHQCHHLMAKLERLNHEHKIGLMPKIRVSSGFDYDINFKWFEEPMIVKFAPNIDEETKAYVVRLINQMMQAEKKYTTANQKLANYKDWNNDKSKR